MLTDCKFRIPVYVLVRGYIYEEGCEMIGYSLDEAEAKKRLREEAEAFACKFGYDIKEPDYSDDGTAYDAEDYYFRMLERSIEV